MYYLMGDLIEFSGLSPTPLLTKIRKAQNTVKSPKTQPYLKTICQNVLKSFMLQDLDGGAVQWEAV